jgi:hypothetical protein
MKIKLDENLPASAARLLQVEQAPTMPLDLKPNRIWNQPIRKVL